MTVTGANPIMQMIARAIEHGQSIRSLYAELRADPAPSKRTAMLEQAHAHAESLNAVLHEIVVHQERATKHPEMCEALQALGELMKQVMIDEREYRIIAGGGDESVDQACGSGA